MNTGPSVAILLGQNRSTGKTGQIAVSILPR
jgi:hypothetical protein